MKRCMHRDGDIRLYKHDQNVFSVERYSEQRQCFETWWVGSKLKDGMEAVARYKAEGQATSQPQTDQSRKAQNVFWS